MRRTINWLLWCLLIRAAVLVLAATVILLTAGWIEGRDFVLGPAVTRALPIGLGFATAWSISRWREQGGDIVLANGGAPLWPICLVISCLVGPPFALSGLSMRADANQMAVSPRQIEFNFGGRRSTFQWHGKIVRRHGNDQESAMTEMTPPTGYSSTRIQPVALLLGLRLAMISLLIGWLVLSMRRPRRSPVILASACCIACSDVLPWVLP